MPSAVAGAPALLLWLQGRRLAALLWTAGIAVLGLGGLFALRATAPVWADELRTLERLFGDPATETPARLILWGEALRWGGLAAPFGLGTGGFNLTAGVGDDRSLHPHNHALEMLAEAGLPGLLLWLLAFGGGAGLALALAGRVAPGRAARIAALTLPVALTAMVSTDLGNRMVWFALGLALSLGVVARPELAEMRNPSMAGLMVKMLGPWGDVIIAAGLIVSVCGAYLSWTIMAAEVPFLAATHKAFPRLFARQNKNSAPSASLWLTNISVQVCLVLIWLTGSDYNTLLTIASEMILVPYFLVGAYLLKIATRPAHYAVGVGACIYGLWLLYASGPMHLLLSVVLYAPGLLVFIYARRTHQLDNALKRREMALIGLLLVAAVPATWMLMG